MLWHLRGKKVEGEQSESSAPSASCCDSRCGEEKSTDKLSESEGDSSNKSDALDHNEIAETKKAR